ILAPPLRSTLFPYTTLFRSECCGAGPPTAGGWGGARHPDRTASMTACLCLRPPPDLSAIIARVRWETYVIRLTTGRVRATRSTRSEEHTSELQSRFDLVCRL